MTIQKLEPTVLYMVAIQEAWLTARADCLQMAIQVGSGPLGDLRTSQINGLADLVNSSLLDPDEIKRQLQARNEKRWKKKELLTMLDFHIDELKNTALKSVIGAEHACGQKTSSPPERNARVAVMHQQLVRYYLNTAVNFSLADRSRGA